jgi:peptide/nickel transport system substrate-binding protein
VLGGAALTQQSFLLKGLLGYTADIPYTRDVEKAKRLLAEGGYPQGFEMELKCPDHSPWLELAMKLRDDLAQIGVIAQVMLLSDTLLADATNSRDLQMHIWQWWYDYADTDANAKAFAHCYDAGDDAAIDACLGSAAWVARYVNPETSKLVEQAARELDTEKRRALYEQINAIIVDDGPFVFLYAPIIQYAVRTEVVQSIQASGDYEVEVPKFK